MWRISSARSRSPTSSGDSSTCVPRASGGAKSGPSSSSSLWTTLSGTRSGPDKSESRVPNTEYPIPKFRHSTFGVRYSIFVVMPNIGSYHPVIVHFAIALLITGVAFRWLSLTGRAPFAGPAAATLLIAGTVAAGLAAHSGLDAHGPVERIRSEERRVGEECRSRW